MQLLFQNKPDEDRRNRMASLSNENFKKITKLLEDTFRENHIAKTYCETLIEVAENGEKFSDEQRAEIMLGELYYGSTNDEKHFTLAGCSDAMINEICREYNLLPNPEDTIDKYNYNEDYLEIIDKHRNSKKNKIPGSEPKNNSPASPSFFNDHVDTPSLIESTHRYQDKRLGP